jgi:hypothetical protein
MTVFAMFDTDCHAWGFDAANWHVVPIVNADSQCRWTFSKDDFRLLSAWLLGPERRPPAMFTFFSTTLQEAVASSVITLMLPAR